MPRDVSVEESPLAERRPRPSDAVGPDSTFARRLWYDSAKAVVGLAFTVAFRIRYTGVTNVPTDGGALVVSNHQSHLDPPLIGAGYPRRMNFLARDTLFRNPHFARLIRSLNAIPLDREGGGMAGMKQTLRRLKRGEFIVVFPEGTRTKDGEIAPFRRGFATLAIRSHAAIVPATIEGAFDCWPRTQSYPLPRPIHVHYNLPIFPEQLAEYREDELVREVESRVRAGLAMIRKRPIFGGRRGPVQL
ncbi:MAG: 1-acyl-sn-glycerol-3-phosphate acyltransferase [Pirellulales bacterium]|nr:1-acyl-sn-glycerol-3-phosphate acyltransferase [Pirellulales bacterium]